MKKISTLALLFSLTLSACALPFFPTAAPPAPTVDLEATAAVLVQATLLAQPTPTLAPTNTAVVSTPSLTEVPSTPTETQNAALLTLTATLGTGTPAITVTGTVPTATSTPNPSIGATATETLHARFFGTQPPKVRFIRALLVNRARAEAYLSLQCTTPEDVLSISEYPVPGRMEARVPVGNCLYVAWVGGNKMFGNFVVRDDDELTITLFKDKVVIAK